MCRTPDSDRRRPTKTSSFSPRREIRPPTERSEKGRRSSTPVVLAGFEHSIWPTSPGAADNCLTSRFADLVGKPRDERLARRSRAAFQCRPAAAPAQVCGCRREARTGQRADPPHGPRRRAPPGAPRPARSGDDRRRDRYVDRDQRRSRCCNARGARGHVPDSAAVAPNYRSRWMARQDVRHDAISSAGGAPRGRWCSCAARARRRIPRTLHRRPLAWHVKGATR